MKLIVDKKNRQVLVKINRIDDDIRRGIRQALYFSGKLIMRNLSTAMLKKPRHGRVYFYRTSSGARRRHVASRPGETPANRTGNLRRSRKFLVRGWHKLTPGYGAEYGDYLEFGTKKIKARPGILNAIKKNEKNMDNFFDQEIRKALK